MKYLASFARTGARPRATVPMLALVLASLLSGCVGSGEYAGNGDIDTRQAGSPADNGTNPPAGPDASDEDDSTLPDVDTPNPDIPGDGDPAAPVAITRAAPPEVAAGDNARLVGTPSKARKGGQIVSWQWTQTAGTPVTLTDADTPTARFVAPAVAAAETLYFVLTITDDLGRQAQDTATLIVNPDRSFLGATQVSAGGNHSCAVMENASVRCWGLNISGETGTANLQNNGRLLARSPIVVQGLQNVLAVTTGARHSCALRADGRVQCWGDNSTGQLGNGQDAQALPNSSSPVMVAGIDNAVAIDARFQHTCALLADDSVACWGDNRVQQLGQATAAPYSATPLVVPGIGNATGVATGNTSGCATLTDGSLRCWGGGLLGDGNLEISEGTGPTSVLLDDADKVAGGGQHHCALLSEGSVWCWGVSATGALGDGIPDRHLVTTPVRMRSLPASIDLAAGENSTCMILRDNSLACTGANDRGQLGDNKACGTDRCARPTLVSGSSNVSQVSVGMRHACSVQDDGSVRCWGAGDAGQLGNGDSNDSAVPVTSIGG